MTTFILFNCFSIIATLVCALLAWNMVKNMEDAANRNNGDRVAVKIDYKGRYRHDRIPQFDKKNLIFWLRLCIVVATLALLFIPIESVMSRS